MKKEQMNNDFDAMMAALENAFDIFFYKNYIKFRLNPETIEESEASKLEFERAREGTLKRFKKAFPGKVKKNIKKCLINVADPKFCAL